MDTGIPDECNSPLAIEFSDGPHRIFSNCGMPALRLGGLAPGRGRYRGPQYG